MKDVLRVLAVAAVLSLADGSSLLAARGGSPPAFGAPSAAAALGTPFGRRCIPPPPQRGDRVGDPGSGCVAPPSNIPDIATPPRKPRAAGAPVLGRRALPFGRRAPGFMPRSTGTGHRHAPRRHPGVEGTARAE